MNDVKLFRKVLVFDTAKQSKVEFESSATIWGDLKKELYKYDIGTSNCKFIEGSTKLTLYKLNLPFLISSIVLSKNVALATALDNFDLNIIGILHHP